MPCTGQIAEGANGQVASLMRLAGWEMPTRGLAARRLAAPHLPRAGPDRPDQVLWFICATHRRQLTVAHASDRLAAQLFAALPPVALLGALELLMSVVRTGLPHQPHPTGGLAMPRDRHPPLDRAR